MHYKIYPGAAFRENILLHFKHILYPVVKVMAV